MIMMYILFIVNYIKSVYYNHFTPQFSIGRQSAFGLYIIIARIFCQYQKPIALTIF